MNDILIGAVTSAMTAGGIWAIFKGSITEAVRKSIAYKFDVKLQDSKKQIDIELKLLDSQLKANGMQVESLINNNLSALDYHRQKQIEAIEVLWHEIVELRKQVPGVIAVLDSLPSEFYEVFVSNPQTKNDLSKISLTSYTNLLRDSKARKFRVFSGALLYSYFELYQSVIGLCLMHTSVEALDGKFSHWYEKYDLTAIFPDANVDFKAVDGKLAKTQHILALIENSFLADAEKIITGEAQMFEGQERANQINKMRSQLVV
ncbi:hypothetical protein CWO01_06230 [Vibrio splendidus]|uniref:hypothetical protein n=1 Tax=Vibrio splendidus TaxID=29497 RepID=UPI000D3B99BA|nr:hypothetical protein [Vibrio splendidus]PTP63817.1 hypothetical protein CWO01_06230 [Vibrio splendidus]